MLLYEEYINILFAFQGKISTVWEIVTKCSVSEAILSLMKLTEAEREAGCCLRNRITWQALAALCVLDHDHVEKLSSARSSSQKNKVGFGLSCR